MENELLCTALTVYFYALFAYIILSFVRSVLPPNPGGIVAGLHGILAVVGEPVLGPLRRLIPPVRFGMGAIDLSPLVVIFGFQLILFPLFC